MKLNNCIYEKNFKDKKIKKNIPNITKNTMRFPYKKVWPYSILLLLIIFNKGFDLFFIPPKKKERRKSIIYPGIQGWYLENFIKPWSAICSFINSYINQFPFMWYYAMPSVHIADML